MDPPLKGRLQLSVLTADRWNQAYVIECVYAYEFAWPTEGNMGLCLSLVLSREVTCIFIMQCTPGKEVWGAGLLLRHQSSVLTLSIVGDCLDSCGSHLLPCEPEVTWNSVEHSILGLKHAAHPFMPQRLNSWHLARFHLVSFFFKVNFNFIIVGFISICHQI